METNTQSTVHALVLDDEPLHQELLKAMLEKDFPDMQIELRSEPDPSGEFELFFLDNDFHGEAKAGELARAIRKTHPNELIIAFSGTLDAGTLKELVDAGCNGVCDKTVRTDLPKTMELVRHYVDGLTEEVDAGTPLGVMGAIRSISALLKEWNQRLDDQEQGLRE